ncbi:MAG: TIR domain-containing protein [Chloroflexi bacterium]|nr:TIR domain-containing protein [Chloroflexota bacterium]MCC6895352.1 TIR domain-containing protein [Anaerolineae bacterium]
MRIFISYASKNRELVRKLAEDLNDLGHEVWFDRELSGGQQWWEEILNSIRDCDLFIFALTQESLDSRPCKLEYTYASQLRKRILPVLMADVTLSVLPPELAIIQFVDYREADKKATIAFNRAMNMLPPPQLLPDPLPVPPPAPVSPLSDIRAQIDVPSLTVDEQRLLVAKLADYVKAPDTANDARALLRRLRQRDDLLAKVDREISLILSGGKSNKILPRLFIKVRSLHSAVISPDGKYIVAMAWGEGVNHLLMWSTITGEIITEINIDDSSYVIKFLNDNESVLTRIGSDKLKIFNIHKREFVSELESSEDVWISADINLINRHIILVLNREIRDIIQIWNIDTYKLIWEHKLGGQDIRKVSYSNDGSKFLIAGDAGLFIFDTLEFKQIRHEYYKIADAMFSPDGNMVCVCFHKDLWSREVKITNIDPSSFGYVWYLKEPWHHDLRSGEHDANRVEARRIIFCSDGKTIITHSSNGLVKLWDTSRSDTPTGHTIGYATKNSILAISKDGKWLITEDEPQLLRLSPTIPWDYDEGVGLYLND